MKLLRIRCECGRNLADVRLDQWNHRYTRDKLAVRPRPNVEQKTYSPMRAADRAQMRRRPRASANPGRVEGVDFDRYDRTYIWRCPDCGRNPQRRHERIAAVWREYVWTRRGVVVVVLDRDL